jgi:hypothetical protein
MNERTLLAFCKSLEHLSGPCLTAHQSLVLAHQPPDQEQVHAPTIMALIDRHYLARPYYGSRRMAAWLATQGHRVNRKRVQRLMRRLGLAAIYQRPNTSKPAEAHKIYPYLLRGPAIERVNQVWGSDITYIPMAKGFVYLVVIMDWVSRAVLAWRLSNTLDADFCVEALEEALSRYGRPEIFSLGYRTPWQIYQQGLWICGRSALPTGCASPASRASSEGGEMLTFTTYPPALQSTKRFILMLRRVEALHQPLLRQ